MNDHLHIIAAESNGNDILQTKNVLVRRGDTGKDGYLVVFSV